MPTGIYDHKKSFVLTPKRLENIRRIGFKKGHKQSNTGKTHFKKGAKLSEETKRKIGLNGFHYGMLGKKHNDSTKQKLSTIRKGIKTGTLTEEHKIKISKANKGNVAWNKGKTGLYKHTLETRKRLSLAKKGNKSHLWKGGITQINSSIRNSIENRLWREAVFARDNWTCQKYGTKGCKLNAHHILNFAKHPELRFALDNGITLSNKAHREFHKIYGKENNTKKQINEFLNICGKK